MTKRDIDKPMNSREWTIITLLTRNAIEECTDPECKTQLERLREKCQYQQLAAIRSDI